MRSTSLPEGHSYANEINSIQAGIAVSGQDEGEDTLPFDAELIPRSVAVLLGGPQEKMAYAQYLMTQTAQATDEDLKALLNVIQLALFSTDLS